MRSTFELPAALEAHEPPAARDDVRLMVATRGDGAIEHTRFHRLAEILDPGDLLVINTSATLPAALSARRASGERVEVRFATEAPDPPGAGWWVVEVRATDGGPWPPGDAPLAPGERLTLPGCVRAELAAPYGGGTRLWLARVDTNLEPPEYLWRHGRPIRYAYVPEEHPLSEYQTVYAQQPGSAEMPSAGRPFTPELITQLVARGIQVAPIVLHTGVSSPERDEPPYPERFAVPPHTMQLVGTTRGWGGRVIAVGTTVVRALESGPGSGWTDLVIEPGYELQAVDGLLTGWHEPRASHLRMLEAVAGADLLDRSYRAALDCGYLWHEFGDCHLILP